MERYHDTRNDLPTPAGREAARKALDEAIEAFMSQGGGVSHVGEGVSSPTDSGTPSGFVQTSKTKRTDAQLRAELLVKAKRGNQSLGAIAKELKEPLSRCQEIARRYRIEIRTPCFQKGGRS